MSAVAGEPVVSVVVPAVNTYEDLRKTMAALQREAQAHSLEVVIVSRLGEHLTTQARRDYPEATILAVTTDVPIPQMRARAFEVARGTIVAVIEDHVQVPPGWVSTVLASRVMTGDVVAGPVSNLATSTLVDRAAFLCEYSHCLPPVPSGESDWLPGNSVAYRADVLRTHMHTVAAGGWENELHAAMRQAGHHLWFVADLEVGHDKHYSFGEYLTQRYYYARSYAGNRVKGKALPLRLVYGAAAAILPALLFQRIVRRVAGRPEHRGTLVASIPLLVAFVLAWGAGEVLGYVAGPGDSLSRVC